MPRPASLLLLCLGLLALHHATDACTTVLVTAGASATGVPMIMHNVDCWDCDNRIALVPSKDHPEGSKYDVYGIGHMYPFLTSEARAWIYRPQPGMLQDKVMGQIPEVEHTYAAWESNYVLMNEKGLTIGESSCAAKLPQGPGRGSPDAKGNFGDALFSIAALIRLATARCETAVCAVEVMGAAAVKHGFYGEGMTSGEALTIVDATGDGWMFHISADPSTVSALWAAKRVEDGHVAVVANAYTLREIDPNDPNTMFSENLFSVTKDAGLWDGDSAFDWAMVLGDFSDRPWYRSVRQYSVQSRVAPSLDLKPKQMPYEYAFSVAADEKLDRTAVMNLFRNFYEGTEFDLTGGVLGGFFGLPYRFEMDHEGGSTWPGIEGQFARPLSLPRTAYSLVGYPDPKNPIAYVCTDQPATGVYVPFLAKTLTEASKAASLEDTMKFYSPYYASGNRFNFTRDSAWWAFDFVSNWMQINFKNMSRVYVYPAVAEWQQKALAVTDQSSHLTDAATAFQNSIVQFWWSLADMLVVRYNDNYYNFPEDKPLEMFTIGYPKEIMRAIGYSNEFLHPVQVVTDAKCNKECPIDRADTMDSTATTHQAPVSLYSVESMGNVVKERVAQATPVQVALLGAVSVALVFTVGLFAGAYVRKEKPTPTAGLYQPLI